VKYEKDQNSIRPINIWYLGQCKKIDWRKKKRERNSKQFDGGNTDHAIN